MNTASTQEAAKQDPKTGTDAAGEDLSMEQILHSIRKIIAEDDTDGKKPNGKTKGEAKGEESVPGSDVLELTEMLKDDGSVMSLKPEAAVAAGAPADVLKTIDQALAPEKAAEKPAEKAAEKPAEKPPAPAAAPVAAPAAPAAKPPQDEVDSLLAEKTTASATEKLKKLQAIEPGLPPLHTTPSPVFNSGETVEGMVISMLRPMMKSWLDANLPQIVDRIVEREVRKLTKYITDKGE